MAFDRYHQCCLDKLIWATEQLEIAVSKNKLSQIAELIIQTMSGPWRYFHNPEHILVVGGSEDPIEVLAALFHDVVYVQVDQSVNFNLSYYIAPFIKQVREKLVIRHRNELPNDLMFEMVAQIFGFQPGQELSPYAGQNEFLSALVAAKVYSPFLPLCLIVQIVACIEATIPFRAKSASGLSASDKLYLKLLEVNQYFSLGLSNEEITETIKRTVRLANRDVSSFADPNASHFLDNTWSLLPETNHNFGNPGAYTIYDYRMALQKMAGFLGGLQPEVVFQQFENEPDEATYQGLIARAKVNLEVSRLYLSTKLVTIAFLESLSLRIGKDIPLATIMGGLHASDSTVRTLVDFLPDITNCTPPKTAIEREVFVLLDVGRCKSSDYDLKNSPLATFIVKLLGFEQVRRLYSVAQQFFQERISAEEFLACCNPELTRIVTAAIAQLFDNRKLALSQAKEILNVSHHVEPVLARN